MPDVSSSTTILEYLEHAGVASARGIADETGLTAAAVRYHLRNLVGAGQVILRPTPPTEQRGRPQRQFQLSPQAIKNNFTRLCEVLLTHRLQEGQDDVQTWADLAEALLPAPAQPDASPRQLRTLVALLSGMDYAARWEAGPAGPRILFSNCPYASILEQFPGLCSMDRRLIENTLGMPFRQSARIHPARACVFEAERPKIKNP